MSHIICNLYQFGTQGREAATNLLFPVLLGKMTIGFADRDATGVSELLCYNFKGNSSSYEITGVGMPKPMKNQVRR